MPKKKTESKDSNDKGGDAQGDPQPPKPKRPPVKPEVKLAVWVAAGGRCTFCNSYLLENEELGEPVSFGELAHNAGWGENSPRGNSTLSEVEREQPDNFLLLCRNCHKAPDKKSNEERYSEDVLKKFKEAHEKRIRFMTGIGADKRATIVRVVGQVRSLNPALTYATVLEATTSELLFPAILPYGHKNELELDLRNLEEADFQTAARLIDRFTQRISEGVADGEISRLAIFGFARMPVLVHLGAKLDDKIEARIFQRQRVDDKNAWRWPEKPPVAPTFESALLQKPTQCDGVAVIINLSGTIKIADLPDAIQDSFAIYEIRPQPPLVPEPTLISSPMALANYESALRLFLSKLESEYGKLDSLSVFQAAPVSAAITLGRVLMPNVSPRLMLFERGLDDKFYLALEVKR